jgi:chromosome transmission fidelity protein 1
MSTNSPTQIAELGQILSNFVNIVPGGMVAFFPSYSFLNTVKAEWATNGMMERFNAKKKVRSINPARKKEI